MDKNKKYSIEEIKAYACYWLKPALCTDAKDSVVENERLVYFMRLIDLEGDRDSIDGFLKRVDVDKYVKWSKNV